MALCPRNAADYGHTLTEQQAEEWCNRVKGKQCNGIKCRWNKEKDGQKRYVTEIVAREMKMLSPKPEGAGSSGASGGGYGGGDPFPEPPPMGDDVPF